MTASSGYRLIAVPDVVRLDGEVEHGQVSVDYYLLLEKRLAVWDTADRMAASVSLARRNFTSDETRYWNELHAELNALDVRLERILMAAGLSFR